MKNYYTVNDITNNLIKTWDVENNSKNFTKIRQKITRQLKQNKLWDNAKQKKINGTKTKIWSTSQVFKLERQLESYMAKITNTSVSEIEQARKLLNQEMLPNQEINYDKDELDRALPTNQELLFVMIKTLFNEKYEIDINQWQNDKLAINDPTYLVDANIQTLKAVKRLENPTNSYVRKKTN